MQKGFEILLYSHPVARIRGFKGYWKDGEMEGYDNKAPRNR